jgi:ferredoxin/flavodoxin---NADP+ reductase
VRCRLTTSVLDVRPLSPGAFLLSFARPDLAFRAGQHVYLTLPGFGVERAYSLYNGEDESCWRVLVREIPGGALTPALRRLRPGDPLRLSPPLGAFAADVGSDAARDYWMIATGTGVAPFHSLLASRPGLRHRLAHGVRHRADRPACPRLRGPAATLCLTEAAAGPDEFQGRVTAWMEQQSVPDTAHILLCGRNEMVYEIWRALRRRGVGEDRISAEVYF